MNIEFSQKQLWELFYILDSRLEGLQNCREDSNPPEKSKSLKAGIKKCKDLLSVIEPNLER